MKIGIIGGYGHFCVRNYPGAEFAFACDGYDDAATARAATLDCRRVYASMDDLLHDFQPDLVYIGTVYARNGALAVRALEAGFDVVSEKPIAGDWPTWHRLRELTAPGKRRIIAELTMRWNPAFRKTRELIRSGAIGEPTHIRAKKSYRFGNKRPDFYRKRELFGGIIPWVAIHAIDYAAWCTGLHYEAATATHGNRRFSDYPEMEDHAALFFRMSGGVPCIMTADFLRPDNASTHGDDRLQITGTEGLLEIRRGELLEISRDGEKTWTFADEPNLGVTLSKDLVAAALGDTTTPLSTADSLHANAAALAARESADTEGNPWQPINVSGQTQK
ncbi:MAG TPA: Gfo/Idh/MocA family oxidoreductase [Chthoniobacteraceae bacterium]|nr:Gfo/Idh/MocA family oxidoreductase [Chthoniobacteraceae bacterium]